MEIIKIYNEKPYLFLFQEVKKEFPKFRFRSTDENFIIVIDKPIKNDNIKELFMNGKWVLGYFTISNQKILRNFFVHPLFRNNGIGSFVLDKLKNREIELYVKMENKKAIDFYIKNNFVVIRKIYQWKIIKLRSRNNTTI